MFTASGRSAAAAAAAGVMSGTGLPAFGIDAGVAAPSDVGAREICAPIECAQSLPAHAYLTPGVSVSRVRPYGPYTCCPEPWFFFSLFLLLLLKVGFAICTHCAMRCTLVVSLPLN